MKIMPAVDKPLDQMSTAELLRDAAHNGMRQMCTVLRWTVDPENIQLSRLVIETANNAGKLLARVEEAGLRAAATGDAVAELGNRLRAIEKVQMKALKKTSEKP